MGAYGARAFLFLLFHFSGFIVLSARYHVKRTNKITSKPKSNNTSAFFLFYPSGLTRHQRPVRGHSGDAAGAAVRA